MTRGKNELSLKKKQKQKQTKNELSFIMFCSLSSSIAEYQKYTLPSKKEHGLCKRIGI